MTPTVEFAGNGKCSYPGILVPKPSAPTTITARGEALFVLSQLVPMKRREGAFHAAAAALFKDFVPTIKGGKSNGTAACYAKMARLVNSFHPAGTDGPRNVQGSEGAWKSDRFASELVGHSLLASFLVAKGHGVFEMDLTGAAPATATAQMASLVADVVNVAPRSLLRCKAELISDARSGTPRPTLTSITVYSPDGNPALIATAADGGVQWELAKIAMHGLGAFVLENVHTAVHLLASVTTSAAARSLPRETLLNGILDASHTQVATAIWEQMDQLQNDKHSLFSGQVYDCDIKALRLLQVKITRSLLVMDPREFLSMGADDSGSERPAWWAGGAAKFIRPIEKFALRVAQGAIADAQNLGARVGGASYLGILQQQLAEIGAFGDDGVGNIAPSLDVATEEGLARFYASVVFFESVVHGGLFGAREFVLPLSMPMTAQFLPFLTSPPGTFAGVDTVEDAINMFVTTDNMLRSNAEPMVAWLSVLYGTTGGVEGGLEISDGPYYNTESWDMGSVAIKEYREEIAAARGEIMGMFGDGFATQGSSGGGFLPGFYYPVDATKPSGYSMTETTYL